MADTTLENQYSINVDNGNSYFNDSGGKITKEGVALTNAQMTTLGDSHIAYGAIRDLTKRNYYTTKNLFTYV